METTPHYKYILPDGRVAFTRREGEKLLGHSTKAFRNLVKKGIIAKVQINSQATSDDNRNIQ